MHTAHCFDFISYQIIKYLKIKISEINGRDYNL